MNAGQGSLFPLWMSDCCGSICRRAILPPWTAYVPLSKMLALFAGLYLSFSVLFIDLHIYPPPVPHCLFFVNIFYWLCYSSCPILSPLFPSTLHTLSHPHSPPLAHVHGHTCKFFGYYISCTILNPPCLFSTYHLCYLFSVPFPLSPPPTPPLITLHVISISVVLFLF